MLGDFVIPQTPQALVWVWGYLSPQSWRVDSQVVVGGGAVAQWSEHLRLKQEALGSILGGYPGFFLFQLVYSNVDRMKDLCCSSTVQHRHKYGKGSVVL